MDWVNPGVNRANEYTGNDSVLTEALLYAGTIRPSVSVHTPISDSTQTHRN